METQSIHEIVRKMESDDKSGNTTISKYVNFNMRENIEKIDAYLNSKHISGETDSKGREKPFFNIVTAATNIWYRATDIDRKNIEIKPTKKAHYVLAFLATLLLQNWMIKACFGKFLNEWGRSLARYGSSIVKFVEKDGELYAEVIPWQRMIVDPIDFENNPQVEILWLTPAQLRKNKAYDQEMVNKLIDSVEVRETPEGQDKDTKSEYIKIYELHGDLSLSHITEKESDKDDYTQQMHVISFQEKKDNADEFDEYTLLKGKEKKSPYMITHLIKEEGRTQSIGAVEHLFESQWMHNHSIKTIKDQLDLASKLIFQTSDGKFIGQNVLSNIEQGDILIHQPNEPLTQIANTPDITSLQSFGQQWRNIGNEATGISEAMLGASPKSGTAWRQTEALLQESHSLFELMTENKGLYIEEMLRKYIIPHLKKKIDTTEEVSAILDDHKIKQFDMMYVPKKIIKSVNQKIKDTILSGKIITERERQEEMLKQTTKLKEALSKLGNQRFIKPSEVDDKTWAEVLKDLEWEVMVDVTGEAKNSQAVVSTLTTVLQTIAGNPQVLEDERARTIFNKILTEVGGISPVELTSQVEPTVAPVAPQTPQTPQGQQGQQRQQRQQRQMVGQQAGQPAMVGAEVGTGR